MKIVSLVPLISLALAGMASAGPLADALKRHAPADVTSLRAERGDDAARCTLGAVYARRNDLSRAALYLTGCEDVELPSEVAVDITRIRRDVKKQLDNSDLAVVEIITNPENMVAEIDSLPGETFTTPATLYVKAGSHTINATAKDGVVWKNSVTVTAHSRAPVLLGAQPKTTTPVKKDHKIDFTDDHGAETQTSGPPPAVKHTPMIKGKYAAGLKATAYAGDDPNGLQDPMAVREETGPRAMRPYWLGLRIGGGMFDDGATSARAGVALAATGRFTLAGRTFLAGRLDWSRRGGDSGDALDVIGASAGAGRTVVETRDLGIALIAQLRGDLRLASDRGDAMTVPVNRAGITVAAGLEISLPRTPFTAGLRFEQGLTPIVAGARDRAMLVEVGVDWR